MKTIHGSMEFFKMISVKQLFKKELILLKKLFVSLINYRLYEINFTFK
jgi:hypothetical protein